MDDSENEGGEVKPKRAKITDTDNEDEDNKGVEGENVADESAPREYGGSSDEGVLNDDDENKGFDQFIWPWKEGMERSVLMDMFLSFSGEFVSDFDAMLARKREQATKRRNRRDINLINDNDDIIDQLIRNMKQAAEVQLNEKNHLDEFDTWTIRDCIAGGPWIESTKSTCNEENFNAQARYVAINQKRFTIGFLGAQHLECIDRLASTFAKQELAMLANSRKHYSVVGRRELIHFRLSRNNL